MGGSHSLSHSHIQDVRSWVAPPHDLRFVLMVCPFQASSLQGCNGGSRRTLAADDPGTGSGWQQSKQSWALLAVEGKWT